MLKVSIGVLAFSAITLITLFHWWTNPGRSIKAHDGAHVAVIYAGQTFHEEVTAAISCMLYSLNYTVIVFIENGIVFGDTVLPSTEFRKASSKSFYGQCVSEWVTVTPGMHLPKNPKILVYITYPMLHKDLSIEVNSFNLLQQLQEANNEQTELLLVVHRATDFWRFSDDVFALVPPNQVTFIFLAEHTYLTAQEHLRAAFLHNETTRNRYRLRQIYPILSLGGKGKRNAHAKFLTSAVSEEHRHLTDFAIQGNLGGRHAKRRDLNGTIRCVQALSSEIGKTQENTARVRLSLVGHIDGHLPVSIGNLNFPTRTFSNLPPRSFYNQLSRASFIVTSLGSSVYTRAQATSTVPAALAAGVPLVTSKDFLLLYPCLRDAPVHRFINAADECASIRTAAALSAHNYSLAKLEIQNCSRILCDAGVDTLKKILQPHATVVRF